MMFILGLVLSVVGEVLRLIPISRELYMDTLRYIFALFPPFCLGNGLYNLALLTTFSIIELKGTDTDVSSQYTNNPPPPNSSTIPPHNPLTPPLPLTGGAQYAPPSLTHPSHPPFPHHTDTPPLSLTGGAQYAPPSLTHPSHPPSPHHTDTPPCPSQAAPSMLQGTGTSQA